MIDLREMLKAGIHFGHKTSRWCPKMRPFIWGAKNKVHLIDVSKTAILLEKAGKFIKEVSSEGGSFLWIGTKKPAQAYIQNIATSLKMPYVINRWVGGTLSNYEQVKKAITRLLHLRDVVKKASAHYKKKEIVMINKEIARLEKNVGGIIDLEYPPAALIVVDAKKEQAAIKEASRLGLPIIAIVDTNTDPEGVSLIIPSNDDSPRAINYILEYLAAQAKDGVNAFEEKKAKERLEHLEAKKQAATRVEKIETKSNDKEHPRHHTPMGKETPKGKELPAHEPVKKPVSVVTPKASPAASMQTPSKEEPAKKLVSKAPVASVTKETVKETKEPKAVIKKETKPSTKPHDK